MNLLRIHHDRTPFLLHRTAPRHPRLPSPPLPRPPRLRSRPVSASLSLSAICSFRARGVSKRAAPAYGDGKGESLDGESVEMEEDLSVDGVVYQNTLRLVECSMFAALSGLVYFLSNSLSIEVSLGGYGNGSLLNELRCRLMPQSLEFRLQCIVVDREALVSVGCLTGFLG